MSERRVSLSRATLLETRIIESIRVRMERVQLSQRQVERKLGWGRGTLSPLLNGRRPLTMGHLETIGIAVGFTPHDVMLEVLGVPYGIQMRPEHAPCLPSFRHLEESIVEVERKTAADLGQVRTELRAVEKASMQELLRFMVLFREIVDRYAELTFHLHDLVQSVRERETTSFSTH